MVRDLNTDHIQVRTNNNLTPQIKTMAGIRQGNSLSPLLFNLIMEQLIEAVKHTGLGYRVEQHQLNIMCYVDDAVLAADTEGSP